MSNAQRISAQSLAAACLLDWLAGDPEWFPHPVRLIGHATQVGEALLRRRGQTAAIELVGGGCLTIAVVGLTYTGSTMLLRFAKRIHPSMGMSVEVLLASSCLAARNLIDESRPVLAALGDDDLAGARRQLARIVGRDTQQLSDTQIYRALIETLAESACDGIIAPLFFLAAGGVPLAMAYKAVNTLDSIIGHADHRYFYFGKMAARLDDAANYVPSRLTALGIILLTGRRDARTAWHTWRRDGRKHKSPNAGNPESAMAGALRVRLGGENTYAGECITTPLLGAEFPPPERQAATRAMAMVIRVSMLGAVAAGLFIYLRKKAHPAGVLFGFEQ